MNAQTLDLGCGVVQARRAMNGIGMCPTESPAIFPSFIRRRASAILRAVQFRKIAIIGVGLLGGSLGLAVRKFRLAGEIAGFVRREKTIAECEKVGALDYATTDLLAAVSNADLVILCTPLAQMRSLAEQCVPALKRGAIVTDVGSVKAGVVRELESVIAKAGAHFVGSHPMAGGEKTGVAAARADLFVNAACVLTPTRRSNAAAVRKLERFWKSLGSRILKLPPEQHDLFVSRTSHLPHVIAATLANLVLGPSQPKGQSQLCATGFRDTTRIASGSPEMWRDISLANRKHVARSITAFISELQKFEQALRKTDEKGIEKFFESAKSRRDQWRSSKPISATD
ncbi:MAG TPA: prephenate dehydrogenase/arogenate dehydrogenase family protein [Candidatus Acidoferrales bacterium]|nr:prephenate dehydrogenase/arogenate dehydrogenase family protein [Candidatus Acidoferrales bacterium]